MKDRIRSLMPPRWWSLLRRTRRSVESAQPRVFGKSPALARFYYTFSTKFGWEMKSVMAGRTAHLGTDGVGYRLRRNIHRIEKGLISRPRRANFATSYITGTVETLDSYLRGVKDPDNDPLAVWSIGVLASYFDANAPHPTVDAARQVFDSFEPTREPPTPPATPYLRPVVSSPVDYDSFFELSRRRRSVRWYTTERVSRGLVDLAIEAAVQAPSACNRQPFVFKVFDDPELVRIIANLPGGATGFADGITGIIVVIGDLSAFASDRDRHLIYIDSALASMAFMLGAETLGFSTCPLNWPDIAEKEREIRRIMDLEPYERPVMLIAYGYSDPEGLIPSSVKRPLWELRTYNEV